MKKKLTIKLVNSLPSKEKYYDVWDTELNGYFLRIYPTGTKTYFLFYRNKQNQKRTYKIGSSLTAVQARDIAEIKFGEVSSGKDVQAVKKAGKTKSDKEKLTTLSSFLQSVYKPWLIDNRKSGQDAFDRLARSFPKLANRQLDKITSWDIVMWRNEQKTAGRSEHTSKRNLAELKSMVSKAKEWDFVRENPLSDIKFGKLEDNRVDRHLSDPERKRLYRALDHREAKLKAKRRNGNEWRKQRGYELFKDYTANEFADYLKPMVTLALNTGLRRGELFSLQWGDINLSTKQLTVTAKAAKNKKARYIPLNADTYTTLKQWHEQSEGNQNVFPGKDGKPLTNVRRSWATLLKLAEIERFRFHDMRHDFASQLVMRGVDLYVVKELLGHSTIQVTERYAHLAPKQLEDAVNLLTKV